MDRTDARTGARTDVCVRGAGIVGTSLALALARQGLKVVLQSAPPSSPAPADVRAYALNRASMGLLDELKVWDALPSDAVTAVHDMHIEGDAHRSTLRFSSWSQGVDALAWIVDAAALQAALDEAVRYAPHVQRSETPVDAALVALCEGKASTAREQLGVRFTSRSYGQRAVAARLVSDRPHAGAARQWFRSPDVLALLPFDRPEMERSYALVWSLPDARADAMLALDAAGFAAALAEATQGAAGTLTLGSERAAWPLMLAQAEPVCGAGWALLGDCAHVVHPLAGQGLNLGLADVATLARVLRERERWRSPGDEKLLRRYARARELPTFAMAQLTDGLLHLFAHKAPAVRELRNRGLGLVNLLPPVKRWLAARALDS